MDHFFKKELSENEAKEAEEFYNTLDNVAIEQHPQWHSFVNTKNNIRFFYTREKSTMTCFSIITEKVYPFFKTASIRFGPLSGDPNVLIESIKAIRSFYKSNGYAYLSIQLCIPTGSTSDYIEYRLNKELKIQYIFDRQNWSSLVVYLDRPLEEISKSFSKGHKSALKKSIAQGISTRKLLSVSEIEDFFNVYEKMNHARGLGNQSDFNKEVMVDVCGFLEKKKLGFFLGVFDANNTLIGGIIVIYQGKTARYYKGASDPERKDVSVLHTAIAEAIRISKEAGYRFFDLWGYNHMVTENDQIYFINRFKKGFSSNFIFYPKMMHISLKPWGYFLQDKINKRGKQLTALFSMFKMGRRSSIDTKTTN